MVSLKWIGISAVATGALFLLVSFALYTAGVFSAQKMKTLSVELKDQYLTPTIIVQNRLSQTVPTPEPAKNIIESETPLPKDDTEEMLPSFPSQKTPNPDQKSVNYIETTSIPKNVSQDLGSFDNLLDGYGSDNFSKHFHPADWGKSRWHKYDDFRNINLDDSHQTDITIDQLTAADISGLATKMKIPALNVDAPVEQLKIIDVEGVKQYETPKNVVGRIPTDVNLIESISGWYFGHLESPIRSEGNVFHKLPQIPRYLVDGDPVHVHLTSGKKEYVYKAYKSVVVHESELKLYDAGLEHIVLVTCVNRPYYDHRLVVTARLIDIR